MKPFLKSLWETIFHPSVLIVVIVLLLLKDCNQVKPVDTLGEFQHLRELIKDDSSKLKVIVASDSSVLTQTTAIQASNSKVVEELMQVQEINKKFGTEIKNLQIALKTRLRDTVYLPQDTAYIPASYNEDSSAHTHTGLFTNPWYSAKAVVSSNPSILPGSLNLVVKDSVTYLFHTKKVGSIFNRKEELSVSIVHANPFIKETGAVLMQVPKINKPKKWGIGIQGGVTVIPIPQPFIGIGVTRTFIRF